MARSLGESSPFILAALLVGLLVGWLLWGRNRAGRRPTASGVADATAPSTVVTAGSESAVDTRPAAHPKHESDSEHGSRRNAESDQEPDPEPGPDVVVHREVEAAEQPGSHRTPEPVAAREPVAALEPEPQPEPGLTPVTAAESSARTRSPEGTEDAGKRSAVAPAVVAQPAVRPDPAGGTPATAPQQQPRTGPVAAAGTTSDPVDDLTRIEGVGPKIAAALVASGIRSYRDLAGSDVETLRAALRSKGLRFVPSLPSWPEQARLLADDDTAGLAALTDRLIAGRERAAGAAASPAVPPQPKPEHAPEGESTEQAVSSNGSAVGASPSTPPDDLKRIEGIGPKMASALNAAGITTFEGLAAADESTIRAAIAAGGLRFAPSLVTWPRQARLLAGGDEDGFNRLAGDLVAGRASERG